MTIDHDQLIAALGGLTITELAKLVTELEATWEVTRDPGLPPPRPPPLPPAPTTFDVVITGVTGRRIDVIRALRTMRPDLDLRGARDLVASVPTAVAEGLDRDAANDRRSLMAEAGAAVEVRPTT